MRKPVRAYADSKGLDQTAHALSDRGLCCPPTESLNIIECINGELMPRSDFAHARMNLNLCVFRMFDDTFLLDAAQ